MDAPIIEELPMTLECTLVSFDEESELLTGEIKNICVDETILTAARSTPPHLLSR